MFIENSVFCVFLWNYNEGCDIKFWLMSIGGLREGQGCLLMEFFFCTNTFVLCVFSENMLILPPLKEKFNFCPSPAQSPDPPLLMSIHIIWIQLNKYKDSEHWTNETVAGV
jgi:hypothetical protein